ncbi:hypothetical protein SEA_DELTON_25 [Mycobacterium phage Delton]|uniref:Tail assembly chaperone n=1 Tax=Mycobacterium phage Delton TaxID=2530186 RepID=A0A481W6E3_9CAUD|nr:hypothetical protein SEA_DELTON_25 [Mycobacterium phage Delton]
MPEISEQELEELRRIREEALAQERARKSAEIEEQAKKAALSALAEAEENKFAVKGWGKDVVRKTFDIQCPSGQWCRAKTLTIEDAMSLGLLDSLDLFTSTLMAPIMANDEDKERAEEERNVGLLNSLKDSGKRASFFGTVNRVTAHCVLEPRVVLEDDGNLPEGTVFADDIPFADKMHIFRNVFGGMGNATMNTFREGPEGSVAAVPDGAPVSGASE